MRMRERSWRLSCLALAGAAVTMLPVPGAGASPAKISAALPHAAHAGATVRVRVRLRASVSSVALQERAGSRWTAVPGTAVHVRRLARRAVLRWRVGGHGAVYLRVVARRGRHIVGVSHIARVLIRESGAPAPPPPSPSPADVAPAVGTLLRRFDGPGRIYVVAGDDGFSIVDSVVYGSEDRSSATTYDRQGNRLAEVPPGMLSGECGANDVTTPAGRLLLVTLISERAAQGVEPATYSVALVARNAVTGDVVWTSTIVPWTQGGDSCSFDGDPDTVTVTADGRWALDGTKVVDLSNGSAHDDPKAVGVLGNWVVDGGADDEPYVLTDPASGTSLGSFATDRDTGISFLHYPRVAERWVFRTDSDGTSPPAGLTSDGARLLAIPNADGSTEGSGTVTGYSLPDGRVLWQKRSRWLGGDGGGVAIVDGDDTDCPDGAGCMVAVDDRTGARRWTVPDGGLCGMTNSQMMLAVNGQLATIDLQSGRQLSYDSSRSSCPDLEQGGIGVASDNQYGVVVTQELAP